MDELIREIDVYRKMHDDLKRENDQLKEKLEAYKQMCNDLVEACMAVSVAMEESLDNLNVAYWSQTSFLDSISRNERDRC